MKTFLSIAILSGLFISNLSSAGLTRLCKGPSVALAIAGPGEKEFAGGMTVRAAANGVWLTTKDGTKYTVRVSYAEPFDLCVESEDKVILCSKDAKTETAVDIPIKDKSGKTIAALSFNPKTRVFSLGEVREPGRTVDFVQWVTKDDRTRKDLMKISRRGGGSLRLELEERYEPGGAEQWGGFKGQVEVDLSAPGAQYESRFGDKACDSSISEVAASVRGPRQEASAVIPNHEVPAAYSRRDVRVMRRQQRRSR